jgi:Glycosyl hydrolase family 12
VWSGSNGANDVISYVAPSAIANMTFNVRDFVADIVKRGKITDDFYLTSIQAGFEPWRGGEGLAIESFRAHVEAR